jgi:hypothetical protein
MKFKPISWEKVVLFGAASFAAYNYGLAGGFIEHRIFSLGGLIAGIVVNVSLAIASSRYGSIKGNKRTLQAQAAFIVMLFVSPLLVSPVIFYSLPDYFLGSQILRAAWAISWPLVADLAIVLAGAVYGKGLIHLTAEQSEQTVSKPRADLVSKKSRRMINPYLLRPGYVKIRSSNYGIKAYRPALSTRGGAFYTHAIFKTADMAQRYAERLVAVWKRSYDVAIAMEPTV